MEPKKVGRALGIGVRVASKMVQQRVAESSAPQRLQTPAAPGPSAGPAATAAGRRTVTHKAPESTARKQQEGKRLATAGRGFRAFMQAFLGPFTHAGSILWLEITGMFFALFALFFVQSVFRARTSWRMGPDHSHLLLYAGLTLVFAWFSGSSFLRARRKSRQGPPSRSRS